MNKHIERDGKEASEIFNSRSLASDYRTLIPILKTGMRVLDVGCGTGAITKDIAEKVGTSGEVIGIDNTKTFIESGKQSYQSVSNLELIHSDLFSFETTKKFDLIVAARTLQWMSVPKKALEKMKSMLQPNGIISILDYNHEDLELLPSPPESMNFFYKKWLQWRADAGMNNRIAEDLPDYFATVGFEAVEVFDSNEVYNKGEKNFQSKIGIWEKVANSMQMVEEGYIENEARLQAIADYQIWMKDNATQMTMKLKEVRGRFLEKN